MAAFENLARSFDLLAKGCRSLRLDSWEDHFDGLRQAANRGEVTASDIVETIDYDYRNQLDGRASAENLIGALCADLLALSKEPPASPEPRATKGGPTEGDPDRPYCKPDQSCCDFCCGN